MLKLDVVDPSKRVCLQAPRPPGTVMEPRGGRPLDVPVPAPAALVEVTPEVEGEVDVVAAKLQERLREALDRDGLAVVQSIAELQQAIHEPHRITSHKGDAGIAGDPPEALAR